MISKSHSASGKFGKAFEEGAKAKRVELKTGVEAYCPYRNTTKSYQEWFKGYESVTK